MLAKIAPKFVISRVIQTSYYANYMSVELLKQIFGESGKDFYISDAKKYFECNFYGYISSLAPPTQFANQFEADKYHQAVDKLAIYNSTRALYQKINEFTLQLKEYFREIEASNTSSNFFSRSKSTDEVLEEDLKDAISRYQTLLVQLEPYPEWKSKVIEQVGIWFLQIHNNLAESDSKRSIFEKMNRQEYFV